MQAHSLKPDTRRSGFTLVELLVVIAIISILAGLLLPALARAQQGAKTSNCLGNMRQIMVLEQFYATAYDGFLPFNYGRNGPYPWTERPTLDIPGKFRLNWLDPKDSNPNWAAGDSPPYEHGPLHNINRGAWFPLLAELSEGNYGIFYDPGKPPTGRPQPDYGQNLYINQASGGYSYEDQEPTDGGLHESRIEKKSSVVMIYGCSAVKDAEALGGADPFGYVDYSMVIKDDKSSGSPFGPGNWHPSVGGDEGSFVGGHHAGNADVYDRVLYFNHGPLAEDIWQFNNN
jgi:prepilin-type N-terminal cleavage/methylation domain-containing protein